MPFKSELSLPLRGRSIVLVGIMGAGKTAVGKRLAARLGLPFFDADQQIEQAAGISIAEIFERHGEEHFRAGEKRVIQRLLDQGPIILAPGGGAFMDPGTRELIHQRAISVWLNCPLPILLNRIRGRTHRPLLNNGDPAEILQRLSEARFPVYAQADITIHSSEDPPEVTTDAVFTAIESYVRSRQIEVNLSNSQYEVIIEPGLLDHAGETIARKIPQPRCIIVTDRTVGSLHLSRLHNSLSNAGIKHESIILSPGEASKSIESWSSLIDTFLSQKVERSTTILAFGGGVIGDLAGFAAASTLRGLPFIQIPTTLLSQVDSSVGGKTGINSQHGKNLIGAFYQPRLVLADINLLKTLPLRERRAGYAEIVKAGLIADEAFYTWCEINVAEILTGEGVILAEAIEYAIRFKAQVVGADEREEKPNDGRALLNFGHTFAHALETETGYGDTLLHGEAVSIGMVLATQLSATLGLCSQNDVTRLATHLANAGLPTRISGLSAERLMIHMKQDKKMRGGKLGFVLTRGIGHAFTDSNVPEDAVRKTLISNGAE